MAASGADGQRQEAIARAIELVTRAMDLLDAHAGPAQAAAYLELALQVLAEAAQKGP